MLCRNRVLDFFRWKEIFDAHSRAQEDAGLRLINMWRSVDEPNNVFLLFEVTSVEKAREFISTPEAARAGEESGVVDGECHFIEEQ
jgi:hypothetical protein